MSSSSIELKIAEDLHAGKTYKQIAPVHHVSNRDIKRIRDLIERDLIKFTEDGKAYMTQAGIIEIESIHRKVTEVVTRQAAEQALKHAEEDYDLGNEIRQYWFLKAQEQGTALREYVRSALVFYDTYRDELEKIGELQALVNVFASAIRSDMVQIAKMDYMYKFVTYCLSLKGQGLTIPQGLVDSFWNDLNHLTEFKPTPFEIPVE